MISPVRVCNEPGCGEIAPNGAKCPECERRADRDSDARRPSATKRGYGSRWRRTRRAFLFSNPICCECGALADVADHDPVSRDELVRRGDPNPDAFHHLRPRCKRCHDRRTAAESPGGWAA